MPYYRNRRYEEYDAEVNRLPSGLFFTAARAEHKEPPANITREDIKQKGVLNREEISYQDFVVPKYNSTKTGKEIYLPLLEVSIEVEVVATIAWSKLTQTFTNRSKQPIKEATYCMPLYDNSTVTSFVCTIGSDKILKGTVKPKERAKAEFKEAVAKQQVAALLEEHTPEVFETTVGNIPAETTVKVEISYITELKADLGGDGVLVTIPTSVAPRYGAVPDTMRDNAAKSLAVPEKNGLQIKIQVSSPVAITKIESRTHPVSIEMGSHGTRVTKDIRDFSKKRVPQGFDPKKAAATLSDRNACLGKDFVLLIHAHDGQLLASRAITEPHPKIPERSALMVSINLRDLYTPNVVTPKTASEIIFVADRSGSMEDSMDALKTAMKFFLKSLPNNCIFNICSFGSRFELMWPKSQPYNQETVDEALSYVANHFSADMGGTEIELALRHVVTRSEVSMNTEIITLTDGEVWDTPFLFHFIEKTRSSWPNENTRFFCLGIGEDVSHHLVAGIGRFGGGLSEVVATDSTGDWMQRVVGMLRAALTPSSWTVEVTLDGMSIAAEESEDKRYIQAPHQIPDLHAFSRSSVYFLLNKGFKGEVVKIKATSVYSGETFTAEIPIEKSDIGGKWVHQLAAKAVLSDLESGRSWIHDKSKNTTDAKTKAEVDKLAKIEGEKIGIEWNISSKWTSFIVVDEKSLQEKLSRWYQAGHSDLAELTRPRFEPSYLEHAYQGAYRQSPANTSSLKNTDWTANGYDAGGTLGFDWGDQIYSNKPGVGPTDEDKALAQSLRGSYEQTQESKSPFPPDMSSGRTQGTTHGNVQYEFVKKKVRNRDADSGLITFKPGGKRGSHSQSPESPESPGSPGSPSYPSALDAFAMSGDIPNSRPAGPRMRGTSEPSSDIEVSPAEASYYSGSSEDGSDGEITDIYERSSSRRPPDATSHSHGGHHSHGDHHSHGGQPPELRPYPIRSMLDPAPDQTTVLRIESGGPHHSHHGGRSSNNTDDASGRKDKSKRDSGDESDDDTGTRDRRRSHRRPRRRSRSRHRSRSRSRSRSPSKQYMTKGGSPSLERLLKGPPSRRGSNSPPSPPTEISDARREISNLRREKPTVRSRSSSRSSGSRPPSHLKPRKVYNSITRPHARSRSRSRSRSSSRHFTRRYRRHSPPSSRSPSPPAPLTLPALLTTQHTLGYFALPRPLRTQLNAAYAPGAWLAIDAHVAPLVSSRAVWLQKRALVLDTVMVVVYVEAVWGGERRLWELVVQKARAWVWGVVGEGGEGVWEVVGGLLGKGGEGSGGESGDESGGESAEE